MAYGRRNPQSKEQASEIRRIFKKLTVRTRSYEKKNGMVEVLIDGMKWKAFAGKGEAEIVADLRRGQGYLARVVKVQGGWAVFRSLTRSLRKIRGFKTKPRIHMKTAKKWVQMGLLSPKAKIHGKVVGGKGKITEAIAKSVYRKKPRDISQFEAANLMKVVAKKVTIKTKKVSAKPATVGKGKTAGKGKAPPKAKGVAEKPKGKGKSEKKRGRPKGSGKKTAPAPAPVKAVKKEAAKQKKEIKKVAAKAVKVVEKKEMSALDRIRAKAQAAKA